MNKKMKFGIISGAGPMAGVLLYQRVIELLQSQGAWRDTDFPELLLHSYPFSDMLSGEVNHQVIHDELVAALQCVSQLTDVVYIACQTLHGFLSEQELATYKVVSLLSLIDQSLKNDDKSIVVVASKTSREFDLHPKFLRAPCRYVESEQTELAINQILEGKTPSLGWLKALTKDHQVILGCTEFSVAFQGSHLECVDPIELAALDIIRKFQCAPLSKLA